MNKHFIICVLTAIAAFPQAQTPLTITQSAGSATGEIRMQERRTNGQNYVGLKAPQSISANTTWTLPDADGASGQCLSTDGASVLSFAACAGYWTLSGSDIYRSTGVVTIGHTSPTVRLGQNLNTNYAGNFGGMALNVFSATAGHGAVLDFNKSASGTLGSHGAVASGDTLGFFVFRGSDGSNYQRAAEVLGEVDGTVSSGVVPGRIRFRTANSSGTITESWRIDKDGAFRPGADDTFDVGLTGTRVRGMYAKFGEFYKSGSTSSSDYLTTRKYNILDQSGGSGAWDIQASGSMASTSSIKIRDNAGSRWLEAYRAIAGTPLKYTSLFGHLYPAKRLISDGDAVDDSVFGDLGASTARWANVWGGTANFTALTLPTGSTTGYVWTDQGSGVGAWAEGGRDAYDVRNFGAVCDGTTDDTSAIESAISAGAANKHKAILPQGTCKVTTIDISNSYGGIRGQGRSNSILYSTTNAPIIKVDNAGPLYYLEFSDFMLKGSEAGTSQTGIESATAGFGVSTIHNLYFENLWRGVKLGHTTDLGDNNIFDCAFSMGGDAVAATALVNGTSYVIGSVGTTDFTLIGAASNTVGLSFTKSGSAGTGTGVAYLSATFSKVGIESLHTSSGSIWSRNFFGGLALPSGATQGPRAFYLHGYVGDLLLNDNHMEGGWIAFDISCDNGTFATGACSYGENLVIQGNKIDGYSKDFRLYNLQNSTILGNRCLSCVKDANVSGTQTKGMIFDVVGRTDLGDAIHRAGWRLTTSYGDLALNAYDEGRIRIGDTSSDISFTKNGISILDASYSSAVALGQSASRNMGMFWTRDATAANAYGVIYTYGYSNPMLYGASAHSFTGGKMSVTNAGPSLGSGQNIADIWATGSTGFVSLGVYRTDDTNGGWLVGTSAVSAGDFAIYQNQGAGTPAKRFLIDTSGTVDIPGNLSVAVMNATGSPAYRVSGTTVIDASRHATFVNLTSSGTITLSGTVASDILFGSSNTYLIGNSTNYLNAIHANNVVAYASFLPASGVSTVDVGSATRRVRKTYTGDLDITGTVTPPSGTAFTGTKTVRASGGASDCTLTFSSGIMTGGTC